MDKKNIVIVGLLALVVALFYFAVFNQTQTDGNALAGAEQSNQVQQDDKVWHWKLATSWPKNFPGLGTAPEIFAKQVATMSGGRLKITVYGAKELVPALGVFDAVSNGSVELGHSGAYYWKGKIPASIFFTTIPFGMTATEMNAWLYEGNGLALWQETYAPFGVMPLAGGNTGVQMGGWFNKEINSLEDMQGLKMRIPGFAGEVLTRLGGQSINIPGGDLYTSLKTGVIDATEWVGPYNDLAMGFHEVAKYYYYPGWHEPGSNLELIVNQKAFDSLPEDLQEIVRISAKAANQAMLDEYIARNNAALNELIEHKNVQLKKFPDEVLIALKKASDEALQEYIAEDLQAQKVYQSYRDFLEQVKSYHQVSEKAYLKARDL